MLQHASCMVPKPGLILSLHVIDFAGCLQPDNWKVSGIDFVTSWINAHIAAAASLGKPLIIEEARS